MAIWKTNATAKKTTLEIYGGTLNITRDGNDRLSARFSRAARDGEGSRGGEGGIEMTIQVHDQSSVEAAQTAAITRLTQSLRVTHPEMMALYDGLDAKAAEPAQKPDLF